MSDSLATRTDEAIHPLLHQGNADWNAQIGHCEWNLQTDVWASEPALLNLYGVDFGAFTLTESTMVELKHPDDLNTTHALLDAIRAGRYQFSFPHRIFRDDGYVRHIHSGADVLRTSEGRPAVLQVTVDALSEWENPLSRCGLDVASDGTLMLGLRAKMPEAVGEAFRRHRETASRAARHYLRSSLGVDDVVQDVFESLFRSPERFNARRGSLATYVAMLTRARCIDVSRSQAARHQREMVYQPRTTAPWLEDGVLAALSATEIRRALQTLPQGERDAIELAFFGGLTYRSVAERLGIPEGTAKGRIRIGLKRLQSSMAQFRASAG